MLCFIPLSEGEGEHHDWKVSISHSDPYTDDRAPPPTAKQIAMAAATGKPYSGDGDDMVKVVVIGSPGVGKTSIIQVRARLHDVTKSCHIRHIIV